MQFCAVVRFVARVLYPVLELLKLIPFCWYRATDEWLHEGVGEGHQFVTE